jgi:hypothetical protein
MKATYTIELYDINSGKTSFWKNYKFADGRAKKRELRAMLKSQLVIVAIIKE